MENDVVCTFVKLQHINISLQNGRKEVTSFIMCQEISSVATILMILALIYKEKKKRKSQISMIIKTIE